MQNDTLATRAALADETARIEEAVSALAPAVRRGLISDGEAYMTVARQCDPDVAAPVLTVLRDRVFFELGFTPEVKTDAAAVSAAVRRARFMNRQTR